MEYDVDVCSLYTYAIAQPATKFWAETKKERNLLQTDITCTSLKSTRKQQIKDLNKKIIHREHVILIQPRILMDLICNKY